VLGHWGFGRRLPAYSKLLTWRRLRLCNYLFEQLSP
jgi:hypothetical protein